MNYFTKKHNQVSGKQAKRFMSIATSKQHPFRPWTLDEIDRLLLAYNVVDHEGWPNYKLMPVFRHGFSLYNELCKIVAGPVPPKYNDFEIKKAEIEKQNFKQLTLTESI